jgi:hypothetical protein
MSKGRQPYLIFERLAPNRVSALARSLRFCIRGGLNSVDVAALDHEGRYDAMEDGVVVFSGSTKGEEILDNVSTRGKR